MNVRQALPLFPFGCDDVSPHILVFGKINEGLYGRVACIDAAAFLDVFRRADVSEGIVLKDNAAARCEQSFHSPSPMATVPPTEIPPVAT